MDNLIVPGTMMDLDALRRQEEMKRNQQRDPVMNPGLFGQVKDAVVGRALQTPGPNLTAGMIRALPIPKASSKRSSIGKKGSGTNKRYSKKLHCIHCGKLRIMKVATMILGTTELAAVTLNLHRVKRMAARTTKEIPEMLVGSCETCFQTTYYSLTNNRKYHFVEETQTFESK